MVYCSHVIMQGWSITKGFIAYSAGVRLHLQVDCLHMDSEVPLMTESTITASLVALEEICVCFHVFNQISFLDLLHIVQQ